MSEFMIRESFRQALAVREAARTWLAGISLELDPLGNSEYWKHFVSLCRTVLCAPRSMLVTESSFFEVCKLAVDVRADASWADLLLCNHGRVSDFLIVERVIQRFAEVYGEEAAALQRKATDANSAILLTRLLNGPYAPFAEYPLPVLLEIAVSAYFSENGHPIYGKATGGFSAKRPADFIESDHLSESLGRSLAQRRK